MVEASMNGSLPAHGGDRSHAERRFGPPPPEGWLDLSTGINPLAYPVGVVSHEAWADLPDAGALRALEAAAAQAYGVGAEGAVTAAPGTQALIQLLPRLCDAPEVTIIGPTYAEHAKAWRAAGRRVVEAGEPGTGPALLVVNPNNPDGRRWPPATLLSALRPGGWLVVDEAFADAEPDFSLAAQVGRPGLVVLRSFGKFYGLAGLRLGFALTDRATKARLDALLGPWAVSGPALEIGTRALRDSAWREETRLRLSEMSDRVDAVLRGVGLEIVGGTALFRLVRCGRGQELYDHLGRRGILVRAFAERQDLLRFGLPKGAAETQRLEATLRDFEC